MIIDQVGKNFFSEHGYIQIPGLLDGKILHNAQKEIDRIVGEARGLKVHNAVYDLEASHSFEDPRVRRIKTPHLHFPFFEELARDKSITDPVAELIGEDIRLYGGKINIKAANYGAPVEWHQDWAFYPHTNDDVLTVVILIDEMDLERFSDQKYHASVNFGRYQANGAFIGNYKSLYIVILKNDRWGITGGSGSG